MSTSSLDNGPAWATSSYGRGADTTPMQLSALGEHLSHCSRPDPALQFLLQAGDAVRNFVLGRLVTSATVLVALAGGSWLIWF